MAGDRIETVPELEGFDAEDHRAGGDAIEILDVQKGLFQLAERTGVKKEDHFEKVGVGIVGIDGGVGAGDSDLMFGKDGGDFGDHPRLVIDRETHVIGSFGVVDFAERTGSLVREKAAVGSGVTSGLGEVGNDGGGGWPLTGSPTVEERFADVITFDGDGIEHPVDRGEDVLFRKKRRLGADFNVSVFSLEDEGEELDDITKFRGEANIERGDFLDASNINISVVDEEAVDQGANQDGLVCGIPTVDVESFIGFGISEIFGFLEGFGVSESGFGHPLQDVVRGAVDDPGNGSDLVSDERFLQGLDDGNSTGDGSFKMNRRVVFFGESEEIGSAFGEKSLVAGDDGFAGFQGGRDEVEGGFGSSDEFDHDINRRVVDDVQKVGREEFGGGIDIAGFGEVPDRDFANFHLHGILGAGLDQPAIFLDHLPDSGPDGSKSGQTNP